MSRGKIAFLIGTLGFIAYVAIVVILGDHIIGQHWAIQLIYYVVAGIIWVIPAKKLIIWGAGSNT